MNVTITAAYVVGEALRVLAHTSLREFGMNALSSRTPDGSGASRIVTYLLHGFAHTSLQWQPVLDAAPRCATDARFVPMPFHESGPVTTFDEAVDRMLSAMPSSRDETNHLVGYSLGARLALGMALKAPTRFATLTLISGHVGVESQQERASRARADARWQTLLREEGTEKFLALFRQQPVFGPAPSVLTPFAKEIARTRAALDPDSLADSFSSLGLAAMPNYWPRLIELKMPVTFVAGGHDTKFLGIVQRAQALVHSPTQLFVVPNAYHDVLADAPEAVAKILESAVSSCPR